MEKIITITLTQKMPTDTFDLPQNPPVKKIRLKASSVPYSYRLWQLSGQSPTIVVRSEDFALDIENEKSMEFTTINPTTIEVFAMPD